MLIYVLLFAVGSAAIMWLVYGAIEQLVNKRVGETVSKILISYSKFQTEKMESLVHLFVLFRRMSDEEFETVIDNMTDVDKLIEKMVREQQQINSKGEKV